MIGDTSLRPESGAAVTDKARHPIDTAVTPRTPADHTATLVAVLAAVGRRDDAVHLTRALVERRLAACYL